MKIEACLMKIPRTKILSLCNLYGLTDAVEDSENIRIKLAGEIVQKNSSLVEQLTPQQQEIFVHVAALKGRLLLRDAVSVNMCIATEVFPDNHSFEKKSSALQELINRGILFEIQSEDTQEIQWVIPIEFLDIWSKSLEDTPGLVSNSPFQAVEGPFQVLGDVFRLMKHLEDYRVRPLQNREISKRHRSQISQAWKNRYWAASAHAEGYVRFLYCCLEQIGLVAIRNNRLKSSEAFRFWVAKPATEQWSDLFDGWMDSHIIDEMNLLLDIKIHAAGLRNPPWISRAILWFLLQRIPVGKWYRVRDASAWIRQVSGSFIRPANMSDHWRIESGENDHPESNDPWEALELRYLQAFITGPLFWMNLVILGLGEDNKPEYFMIRENGNGIDNGNEGDQTRLGHVGKFIVQPDFEILVPEDVVLSVKYYLDLIAKRVSFDTVLRYQLSKESVCEGLAWGESARKILHFLRKNSAMPIPQNVESTVISWCGQYGKIRLKNSNFIEADDEYLLEELLSRPDISAAVAEKISDKIALVSDQELERLVEKMKENGYYPAIERGLMLDCRLAPISINLDRDSAERLFRVLDQYLHVTKEGVGIELDSGLEKFFKRLKKKLET